MNWIYLVVAVCGEVVGTTALKSSEGFSRLLPSLVVLVGYGVAFYFLSLTLNKIPVGISYALWSGIEIVLISIIAWLYLRRRGNVRRHDGDQPHHRWRGRHQSVFEISCALTLRPRTQKADEGGESVGNARGSACALALSAFHGAAP